VLKEKSLVLYKQSPAIVSALDGEKVHIQLKTGIKKVRFKDVTPLHPGPVNSLADLDPLEGDPEEAWELFQGETPEPADLAELIYGAYTPASAWSLFLLLNRTPWFKGTWEEIIVSTPEEREARERAEREKDEAKQRWDDFTNRLSNAQFQPEDKEFLDELRQQALGRQKRSAILKELKKEQIPENAHRLLLKWKLVEPRWNPFPGRFDLSVKSSDAPLNPLPQEERLDLTHITAYAIDDEGSKDPDDAITWDGEYFWVHIADAAAVIDSGSEADLEARNRGGNLYIPEGTVTMLPPEATEKLALGLQPDKSPAFSFRYRFKDTGEIEQGDIFLSWIKVERLSYEQCDGKMGESPFKEMSEITNRFGQWRASQGALSISLPEVKIRVKEQGKGEVEIKPLPDLASRRMVAEAMMMTGNWAASYCLHKGIPIPYASQPTPDQDPPEGDSVSIQFARRKVMQRSRISLSPSRHSGLGLDVYTRATSPLRRYSDLVVMQQLRKSLLGQEPLSEEEVTRAASLYEAQASSLSGAERQSNMHWKLIYLSEQDHWEGEGIFAERRDRQGVFLIPQLALEVRIPLKEKKDLDSRAILEFQSADLVSNQAVFKLKQWL